MTTRDPATSDVVVLDNVGLLAVTDGEVHYVTSCCRAAVTGSSTDAAVECKGCHSRVPWALAESWPVNDRARWLRWVHDNLATDYAANPDNRESGIPEAMYVSVLRQVGVFS